ncbi:hypothetical protein [Sphingomonas sp. G-3-2-10]|uniref:hypothetical protein n=1 Tax=Sphingomonas sp. G-3-2-10 TaxID=2728838 RepID=UPI00146B6C81|nr:hypothetical protein [Sphingomonas sp. G-3-2-10]NML04256.1 hypothetical protein [Sphingomonas sp. G-3-2-10]
MEKKKMTANLTISYLNTRYKAAHTGAVQSERDKITVLVEGLAFIETNGGFEDTTVKQLISDAGIKSDLSDRFGNVAQLITGTNISAISNKPDKVKARNDIRVAAQFMGGLHEAQKNGALTETTTLDIVEWVLANGGRTGVASKFDIKAKKAEPAEISVDVEPYRKAVANNGIAIPLAGTELNAAVPTFGIHMRDENQLRLVPVELPPSVWKMVAAYLPEPDANATADARLWGAITQACQLVERGDSELPLMRNEERREGELKAPRRPIIRISDGLLSIASSRVETGIVIEVEPDAAVAGRMAQGNWHINGAGTNTLTDKLLDPTVRGAILRVSESNGRLLFETGKSSPVKDFGVSILPMSAFGNTQPQWTLRVRKFDDHAFSSLLGNAAVHPDFVKFASKASGSKHPVKLTITKGKLAAKLGKSDEVKVDGLSGNGDASVSVAASDFAQVIGMVAQLPIQNVGLSIDSDGLVLICATTTFGQFSFFVPILIESVRSPALFEKVRKPETVAVEEEQDAQVELTA